VVWIREKRERNFKKMSKNQRAFFFLSIVLRSSFLRVASLLCALPLAKERKALFSLSLSTFNKATEREKERDHI
jgi:hypothetical protein